MSKSTQIAFNSGASVAVERCQVCGNQSLETVLFLGYLPIPNKIHKIGERPKQETRFPAQFLHCQNCHLMQLGVIVDPNLVFPPEFPYTSSSTKILRDNFAELYKECTNIMDLKQDDLIVDIGSNDGNLLTNFKGHCKIIGVTPEEIGKIAIERGIPTIIDYFNQKVVDEILLKHGKAKIITATNVFAHVESIHEMTRCIMNLMADDGVFISESHHLLSIIENMQYDTIYMEHLRYYSLHSLQFLLSMHDLEIFHVKHIPTHGGSMRSYASRKGVHKIKESVRKLLDEERSIVFNKERLWHFKEKVILSKLELISMLKDIKKNGYRIYGVGAAARATTLINYTGIDDGILDYILEVTGSHKIGNYLPGTIIPIAEESLLFNDQPEYALLLSWHIADELIPKLKQKGFKGKYIVPLPSPKIIV